MSWLNDQIESRLRTVRQDARMRPIIDQVKAARQGACSSEDVLDAAVRGAVDSYAKAGEQPQPYQVRERAFLAAAAAATETPLQLCDLPAGADKTQHFFASGLISLKVAAFTDWLLPRRWAEQLGIGASLTVGWLKEVYDKFWGSGYNAEDLKADRAGAVRPFRMSLPPGVSSVKRAAALSALAAALSTTGCGAAASGTGVTLASLTADATGIARLGFGAEGGEKPALVARAAGGWALAYVGTKVGDRHVYFTTSADGASWAKAKAIAAGAYSDQTPALAEDAAGQLHLFFASNRTGAEPSVYHVAQQDGAWGAAASVPGFEGTQDLAVAYDGKRFTLAAEVMGAGLLAATSADGASWGKASEVAPAGAEPAAVALGEGKTLVAYQLEGKIMVRTGQVGAWGEASVAAQPDPAHPSRLRDPGLAFAGDRGELIYSEKGDTGLALKCRSFGTELRFVDAEAPTTGSGDARGAALALDHNGSRALAWGMKTTSGQQGVMVTTR